MKVDLRTAADYQRQPWKNGGGVTTELASHGEANRRVWRVSVADVERSGPFSDFTGYERTLMLLEGDGMELVFEGYPPQVLDRVHQAVVFDGGWKTDCRLLGGPVKDLNLMVDRERAHGSLAVLPAYAGGHFAVAAPWTLLYCLTGSIRVEVAGGEYCVRRGELLRLDEAEGTQLVLHEGHPGATLADIRIVRK